MIKSKLTKMLLIPILCLSTLIGCSSASTAVSSSTQSGTAQTESVGSNNDGSSSSSETSSSAKDGQSQQAVSLSDIPAFSDKAYIAINNNVPYFTDSDYTTTSFETYSDLDSLGRCGVAYANVGKDLMPTEERGAIGQVKSTGWQTIKYDNVDGKYLYNRCHLIGYQLTAENANEKNLITGTRYLNIDGMLSFENMIADYVKETGNHVLYRVTPIFEGNNLVASGVLMEGKSVEDKGAGICFNVYAYNNQPGITINYADGTSSSSSSSAATSSASSSSSSSSTQNKTSSSSNTNSNSTSTQSTQSQTTSNATYVLNTDSHKFHKPTCSSAKKINSANRQDFSGTRDAVIAQGYDACKICNP